jgi:hypothetical protein
MPDEVETTQPAPPPKRILRKPHETKAIVEEISRTIAKGQFVPGSLGLIAEKHGVSLQMARRWYEKAAIVVWSGTKKEIDTLRVVTIQSMHRIAYKAEKNGEYKVALDALEKAATIAGVKVGGPTTVINILEDPSAKLLISTFEEILRPHPELAAKAANALLLLQATNAQGVIDVEPEDEDEGAEVSTFVGSDDDTIQTVEDP